MEELRKDKKADCKEFEKCLEILHLMLDNEATETEQAYLHEHIEGCMICFERYEVEKQIRTLLQTRLLKKEMPEGLVSSIRNKVFQ